jgi:hypothetical protein
MTDQVQSAGRTEVSVAGRLVGLSIMGTAVLVVMFLEEFGGGEWLPMVKYVLLGALVLAIGVPLAFFRRTVAASPPGQ